jgi:hypothetical protein
MRETDSEASQEPPPSRAALDRLRQTLNRIAAENEAAHLKCSVCHKPITLETSGICADERGKVAHTDCYVEHVISNIKKPTSRETQV